jgi:hypothetical protein
MIKPDSQWNGVPSEILQLKLETRCFLPANVPGMSCNFWESSNIGPFRHPGRSNGLMVFFQQETTC